MTLTSLLALAGLGGSWGCATDLDDADPAATGRLALSELTALGPSGS